MTILKYKAVCSAGHCCTAKGTEYDAGRDHATDRREKYRNDRKAWHHVRYAERSRYGLSVSIGNQVPSAGRGQKNICGFGIDLVATNGDDSWTLPMPTRLLVSPDGIMCAADFDPNYTARPEPQ